MLISIFKTEPKLKNQLFVKTAIQNTCRKATGSYLQQNCRAPAEWRLVVCKWGFDICKPWETSKLGPVCIYEGFYCSLKATEILFYV